MSTSSLFDGLFAVVQYRLKTGGGWSGMAAFDSPSIAARYARDCGKGENWPWEYRAVNLLGEVIPHEQAEAILMGVFAAEAQADALRAAHA